MISHVISAWSVTWSVYDQPRDQCMISQMISAWSITYNLHFSCWTMLLGMTPLVPVFWNDHQRPGSSTTLLWFLMPEGHTGAWISFATEDPPVPQRNLWLPHWGPTSLQNYFSNCPRNSLPNSVSLYFLKNIDMRDKTRGPLAQVPRVFQVD